MRFVNLYTETEYSLLSSPNRISDLVKMAQMNNYSSLAITDYNNMYGAIKFYNECLKNNIKPIFGLHFSFAEFDFLFYAKNNLGFKELMGLATLAKIKKEKITLKDISNMCKNCVVVIPGDENKAIKMYLSDELVDFKKSIDDYKKYFKDLYVGLDMQTTLMKEKIKSLVKWCSENDLNCVALHKVAYFKKEDFDTFLTLKSIAIGGSTYPYNEKDMNMYFINRLEAESMFSLYPETITNTSAIADKCNVTIEFGCFRMPVYISDISDKTKYLKELAMVGLNKRLKNKKVDVEAYRKRLLYELDIITKMGFVDYFLIVYDYVKYAKMNGVLVGPGRGSAPSSLVSYSLGITEIDPIKHGLLFERFLNPERTSMPDIDTDFPDNKRDEIIRYVGGRYGKNRVAHISTFGTFGPRLAIRDAARVMKIDDAYLNEVIKYVNNGDESMSISVSKSPILKQMIDEIPMIKKLYEVVLKLEGLPRHMSVHAAGIIMADDDLINYTPLQEGINGLYQTQFDATDLESLGLVKFDFLGIRNLTIINSVILKVAEMTGNKILINNIDFNDSKVYELIASGDTDGIFQLESPGMRNTLMQLKASSFDDIVNALALYRPGPMEMIPSFVRRKFKKEEVKFIHPSLSEVLDSTYGTIVFQEQILLVAQKFAGYTLGQADILRRAVSKKKAEVLNNERTRFVGSAMKNGHDEKTSNQVYDYIVKFANYGFNKSHSVAYSVIVYQMAYLKTYYYKYFMAELMSNTIGNIRLIKRYIFDCNKRKIEVFPPSINKSSLKFEATSEGIYYSLLGIQNLGTVSLDALLNERKENGLYNNYDEFISRTKNILNKRIVESMIFAGALDEFKIARKQMILEYDNSIELAKYGNILKNKLDERKFSDEEYSFSEIANYEKESLGFNLKYDVFKRYNFLKQKYNTKDISLINEEKNINVLFIINNIKVIKTKKNQEMAFLAISDDSGTVDGTLFPDTYEKYKSILIKGAVYLGKCSAEVRNEKKSLVFSNLVIVK